MGANWRGGAEQATPIRWRVGRVSALRGVGCHEAWNLLGARSMPTTVAHIVGGYAAAGGGSLVQSRNHHILWFLLVAVVYSNLPDIDFLLGWVAGGSPVYFHRGFTHSFALGALAAAAGTLVFLRAWGGTPARLFLLLFLSYASHLVLDVLFPDPSGGGGAKLLWPFTHAWFEFPLGILRPLDGLRLLPTNDLHEGFFATVLSWRAVRVFVIDTLVVLPLGLVALVLGRRGPWWARPRTASALPDADLEVVQPLAAHTGTRGPEPDRDP